LLSKAGPSSSFLSGSFEESDDSIPGPISVRSFLSKSMVEINHHYWCARLTPRSKNPASSLDLGRSCTQSWRRSQAVNRFRSCASARKRVRKHLGLGLEDVAIPVLVTGHTEGKLSITAATVFEKLADGYFLKLDSRRHFWAWVKVCVEGSGSLNTSGQRHHGHSLNTASCQNIDIHSLASARSSFDPPRSSVLPFRYLTNWASPQDATTSPWSLNGGKNFSFMRSVYRGGVDFYGPTLKKVVLGKRGVGRAFVSGKRGTGERSAISTDRGRE
jgi:hypothetical protein